MRSRLRQGLALALGGLVLAVGGRWAPGLWAGDGSSWVPAAVGQPIAEAGTGGTSGDAPNRLASGAPVDRQVRPTAYTISTNDSGTPSGTGPRPLPVGPAASANGNGAGTAPTPYTWRQAPSPSPVAPGAAGTPGTVLPTPTPQPGVDGVPVPGNPGSILLGPNGPVLAAPGSSVIVNPGGPGAPVGPGMPGVAGCVPGVVCCDPSCCCGPCCGPCCGDCCGGSCCDGGGCGGCDDGCGWGCNGCCFNNRFYASAEYLLWWMRGSPTPPLVTSGAPFPTALFPGALGQPGTSVLVGGGNLGSGPQSGFRGFVGYWLSDDHALGIEAGGFFVGPSSTNFSASSNGGFGSPILARPFINGGNPITLPTVSPIFGTPIPVPALGGQTEELVAYPGVLAGGVAVHDSFGLWGAEINLRSNLCCGCNYYVDGLFGVRYLGLGDTLSIGENLTVIAPSPPSLITPGTTFLVGDRFAAQNRFYGTQMGLAGEYRFNRWFVGGRAVLGLGVNDQIVDISGQTIIGVPGMQAATYQGGLLTQSSNIGHHTRETFGVVPEIGLNVGYQITNNIRAFVGYNFLYWNNVVRPGNQIDTRVNQNFLPPQPILPVPGAALPAFAFHGSDFWAQGITFGLEFRW